MDFNLFSLTVMFLFIMDPVGNIASYLSVMEGVKPQRRNWVLLREIGIAFAIMILFNYIGEFIFNLLKISEVTVRLASGLILFLVAIKILFPSTNGLRNNLPKEEPWIVPLAIPLIAGPSVLATIMLYARLESSQSLMLGAIILSTLGTLAILASAPYLHRLLNKNGLLALEKLMGMVLVLLGVQRFAEGVQQFVSNNV